jgi:hypothetical protein
MGYHALLAVFQGLPAILAGLRPHPDNIVIGICKEIFRLILKNLIYCLL